MWRRRRRLSLSVVGWSPLLERSPTYFPEGIIHLIDDSITAHNVYYVKFGVFIGRPMPFLFRICGYRVNYATLCIK